MAPASDRAGRIETHGIDYIPDSERHGTARSLFVVWAASNVTYLYIVLGGTLVLLGLDVWQALAVVVAGNLFWALVGWLSISGPSSGTPSEVVTRAMFGVRGNRVFNVVLGWGVGVAYEAINLAIGALAGFALIAQLGGRAGTPVKVLVVLATALVTFTISVYGHATIVRLSGWFTWILLACTLVLGYDVLRHAHWGYQAPAAFAVHGAALWGVAAAGFTIIASSPLSWGTGADYARYLPADVSPRGVMWWTALGGFLPAVALSGLGVLAGTVVDMTNPQTRSGRCCRAGSTRCSCWSSWPGRSPTTCSRPTAPGSRCRRSAFRGGGRSRSSSTPWSRSASPATRCSSPTSSPR